MTFVQCHCGCVVETGEIPCDTPHCALALTPPVGPRQLVWLGAKHGRQVPGSNPNGSTPNESNL